MAAELVSMSCTAGDSKALSVLSALIKERTRQMGELTKDAVVAVVINILISLRAATRDARSRKTTGCKVEPLSNYSLGIRHVNGAPHIAAIKPDGHHDDSMRFILADKSTDFKRIKLFRVTPEHERCRPYIIAVRNARDAKNYESERAQARIAQKGGLAKTALGLAMNQISTKNVSDNAPQKAQSLANSLSIIKISESGFNSGTLSLTYHDKLNYAVSALRNGRDDIETSLKKAANKVASIIDRHVNGKGLEGEIPTPFPEVKKRKTA